ncbi:MAG: LytTR family DNA-binding domain-containing protein [Bacteroidales bacterium]|nr:response regulator transcription factor [Muribaculaceae bacterium]MDY6294655.1 LytTR family DNA-binding domain-containing protein [Bacteroidales bacterium]
MKCVAIDDEPMALEVIKNFCNRMDDMELDTFTNPLVGIEHVKRMRPTLLFLDVKMGEVSGVNLAREIPQGTFLVFTTAYAQFAVDGFDLNAVDFLHKPFSFGRFEKAVNKVRQAIKLINYSAVPPLEGEEITVKVEYKNVKIALSSILYIQAMDNYVKIFIVDGKPVITQMSMKSLETMLPESDFVRVHKSYIVPRHRINTYSRSQLTLTGGTTIPVGRAYAGKLE